MNSKARTTLAALKANPIRPNVRWTDVEALVAALGGKVKEREGSRVAFVFPQGVFLFHRPHPGKEARPYQVRELRRMLDAVGASSEDVA